MTQTTEKPAPMSIAEANLTRKRLERRRAVALNDATRPPLPTENIKRLLTSLETETTKLAKAQAVLADDDAKAQAKALARAARKTAFIAIKELNRQIDTAWTAQTDTTWANRATQETYLLAADRGEDVTAPPVGPRRIRSRDGLLSLLELGRLGGPDDAKRVQNRYDAGMAYREMVEARTGDLGSQMGGDGGSGSAHDNDKFVWARQVRAKKTQDLVKIDIAVAVQCRDEPACLQMLRWVAGQGHSLSAFGEGRAFSRHLDALIRALDVADFEMHGSRS